MKTCLKDMVCKACRGDSKTLKGDDIPPYKSQLNENWNVIDNHHLLRRFDFEDFQQALDFTNHVGQIAEEENHHPVITLTWGFAEIKIWTHKVDGLTESDFILAAKIDDSLTC